MKEYELTEEHRKELKPWADRWIKNAMSTKPMDEEEKDICRKAVKEMYIAANLTPPPDHRIVFVPSPFVLRFAGGFAAAVWYLRKNKNIDPMDATSDATWDATWAAISAATRDATEDATRDATRAATRDATSAAISAATRDATRAATRDATRDATRAATSDATWAATSAATEDATSDATWDATWAATWDATWDATSAATRAATRDATRDATRAATSDATWAATSAATRDATEDATSDATWAATRAATSAATRDAGISEWFKFNLDISKLSDLLNIGVLGVECAKNAYNMWNGGNQWSGYASYLSFFRHVSKLAIDYSKFDSYEKLAIHSGPRIMHAEFCMISDRPTKLLVNDRNQPHCYDGPFCEWSDGSALYSINGIRVPAWVCETKKEEFTKEMIVNEKNADIRREIIRKIGMERVVQLLDYKVIDSFEGYELITFEIGDGRIRPWLKMNNPSLEGVIHIEGVKPEIKTVKEAICYRNNLKEFEQPISLS